MPIKVPCPDCGVIMLLDRMRPSGYVCARCQMTNWRNYPDPIKDYRLSERDRIFLRVNRIAPEV